MLYVILSAALVALDQLVKGLVRANIPEWGSVPLLPGIMDLTFFKNTGAGFSILEGHTWFLTLVSAAISVVIIIALRKNFFRHTWGKVALTVLLAGALGNLIDRAVLGYVTDMFRTLFIRFPVFNLADICVVTGGIGTAIYYLFFYDKQEDKKDEPSDPDRSQ